MKRFFMLIGCVFVLSGMVYAAEVQTQTRTWTDADGVTHTVTITRERSKVTESGDVSEQSTPSEEKSQQWQPPQTTAPVKPKQEYRKTETDLPAGVTPSGSFQFDINSSKPKN